MDVIQSQVNALLRNKDLHPYLAIIKAARNGAVYGVKVRFPHALVMVFLFRGGTIREKLWLIYKATRQHARNLAYFATVYKSSMLLLRKLNSDKEGPWDSFFAGLTGGYVVFGRGRQGSVNKQIVIYVFARVMLALARLTVEPASATATTPMPTLFSQKWSADTRASIMNNAWPVFASLSWAMVMFIFRYQPESLQSSLKSSMRYIYVSCDHWDSFRNFIIHSS